MEETPTSECENDYLPNIEKDEENQINMNCSFSSQQEPVQHEFSKRGDSLSLHQENPHTPSIGFDDFYKETRPIDSLNWNFNDMYVRSNSPMASNCNSDVETDCPDAFEEHEFTESVERADSTFSTSNRLENSCPPSLRSSSTDDYSTIFCNTYAKRNNDDIRISKMFIQANEHEPVEEENRMFNRNAKNNKVTAYYEEEGIQGFNKRENPWDYRKETTNYSLHHGQSNKKYKKFTYDNIEKSLSQYYDKNEHNFTEMDLLVTYLTGMRAIYGISRNITQFKSYSVTMLTVSITILLTIVAPFLLKMVWGAYLISAGNGFLTVLIFLSRYLKYDSNSAQYAFMAKQFNKLEVRVQFENTMDNPSSQKIRDIESTIMEMNEYIQELIPEEAVQLFPLIYQTNIVQLIKKNELYRKKLIIRFRDIKNEIHYILYKWNSVGEEFNQIDTKFQSKNPQQEREKNRILYLMNLKEKTKKELMQFKDIYIQFNELFKTEIRYAETHQSCFGCSSVFKPDYEYSKLNPVVRDYLKLVVPD